MVLKHADTRHLLFALKAIPLMAGLRKVILESDDFKVVRAAIETMQATYFPLNVVFIVEDHKTFKHIVQTTPPDVPLYITTQKKALHKAQCPFSTERCVQVCIKTVDDTIWESLTDVAHTTLYIDSINPSRNTAFFTHYLKTSRGLTHLMMVAQICTSFHLQSLYQTLVETCYFLPALKSLIIVFPDADTPVPLISYTSSLAYVCIWKL